VVVLDRGFCAFTKKALHAQNAGADAVIIVDNVDEPLVTMDASADDQSVGEAANITVPVGLVTKATGDIFEPILTAGTTILVTLNWTDVLPHPDSRVEWELWTNSGDNCGAKCDAQKGFIKDFKETAVTLEKNGYTQFTPHYVTWLCPPEAIDEPFCVQQCINNGRYCCPDPDSDFAAGFSGADVVTENLRTLCVFREANATASPWKWWDYVTQFEDACTMANGRFNDLECAESVLVALSLDVDAIRACVGDVTADVVNDVLENEQEMQLDDGRRGDINILPTVVINDRQYRGKLTREAVLRTLCSGFAESTRPELCDQGFEDKCLEDNEGSLTCARDATGNGMTGCQVTAETPFFACVCPAGAKLVGEKCEVTNGCVAAIFDTPACACDRCVCTDSGLGKIDCHEEPPSACVSDAEHPGGCWRIGKHSACVDQIDQKKQTGIAGGDPATVQASSCKCPAGFVGDGLTCVDVDECQTSCKGEHMRCANTFGSFTCTCDSGFGKMDDASSSDGMTCLHGGSGGGFGIGTVFVAVLASCAVLGGGGYLIYRVRLRSYMNQEIKAIMSQYMPLEDGENNGDGHFAAPNGHEDSDGDEESNRL